jgi:hypothetical protein
MTTTIMNLKDIGIDDIIKDETKMPIIEVTLDLMKNFVSETDMRRTKGNGQSGKATEITKLFYDSSSLYDTSTHYCIVLYCHE